ncbi:MAG: 2-isopropylmalate synthase [Elusimicrobia bacterium ADurb.Bin231]|nr:MAG: 2-isopropylmalate synthase [Elusimicrobia bacterium ADurb.Bin231]
MKKNIIIFDTTLRDGEQSPGASLNTKEKMEIAQQLSALGVDVIEAGFPASSPGDFEAVMSVAKGIKGPVVCGLARAIKKDIDLCFDAVKTAKKRRIHIFLATSPIHMKYKLKMTKEDVLQKAREAVAYARNLNDDVEFSPEDAARSDRDFLCRVVEAVIKAGASTVNIPDTVGYSVPDEFGGLIAELFNRVPNINKATISVHCHNDLGLATANSVSAILNGARQVECTINGLGERAGNASLEEIVMILKTRKPFFRLDTGIRTIEISKTSRLVSSLTGVPIQPNKAIVGKNAFAHEAGIHQHGMLAKSLTYEIMTPVSIGLKESTLVLGKHSGRHAFESRLAQIGMKLSKDDLEKAFAEFKVLADKKKEIYDEDIATLAENQLSREIQLYELKEIKISSGTGTVPRASIKLVKDNKTFFATATGDGPVDACYKAIEKIVSEKFKLLDYSVKSVSVGKDAVGEASVQLSCCGMVYSGRGISTDVIEASVKAFLTAANRILNLKHSKQRVSVRKNAM